MFGMIQSWKWGPCDRISALLLPSALHQGRALQEGGCLQTRKRALTRNSICQLLDLGLPNLQNHGKQMFIAEVLSLWYSVKKAWTKTYSTNQIYSYEWNIHTHTCIHLFVYTIYIYIHTHNHITCTHIHTCIYIFVIIMTKHTICQVAKENTAIQHFTVCLKGSDLWN